MPSFWVPSIGWLQQSQAESADQLEAGAPSFERSSTSTSPLARCRRFRLPSLFWKVSILESGDQCGRLFQPSPISVMRFSDTSSPPEPGGQAKGAPSERRIHSSYSPLLSEKQAIQRPSGLQAGSRSATPLVRVRLRTKPSSTGTVKSSPRASTTTRLALGLTSRSATCPSSSRVRGRSERRSPGMITSTATERRLASSKRYSLPPFSKTTSSGPMEGNLTSHSAKSVRRRVLPFSRSWLHRLSRWLSPRSERKMRLPPCHMGRASVPGWSVSLRDSWVFRLKSQMSWARPPW